MLDQTIRSSILTLREAGHGTRAIARALGISRNAIKAVLAEGVAAPPPIVRTEKAEAHRDVFLGKLMQTIALSLLSWRSCRPACRRP